MRWVSGLIGVIVVAAALFFIVTWGSEAARAFASANFGIGDPSRGQGVRALAGFVGLGPENLVRLAAFLAAYKLATVAAFALALADRIRSPIAAARHYELLESALLLVVLLTAVMAAAAVHDGNRAQIRLCAADFLVAGAIAIASVIERLIVAPANELKEPALRRAPAETGEQPGRALKRVSLWLWG